jgi:hypothetical protein
MEIFYSMGGGSEGKYRGGILLFAVLYSVRPILTVAGNEIPENGYWWTKQRNF